MPHPSQLAPQFPKRSPRPGPVFLIALALLATSFTAETAAEPPQPRAAAGTDHTATAPHHGILVVVERNRVTVDADDADLADVLEQLAEHAKFRLRTKGDLGRVTADFSVPTVEQALRRLAGNHELMIVYARPAAGDRSRPTPIQVAVFGDRSAAAAVSSGTRGSVESRADTLAEIREIARAGDPQRGATRLTQILATATDPAVRGRAVWALGRIGGPAAAAGVLKALDDETADVRVQAIYAIRQLQSSQAIPALSTRLLSDPDGSVRRAAARMLATFSEPEAGAALSAAVQDSDPIVRREVSRALERREQSASR